MPKFIFAYHGGKRPETPAEGAKIMEAWMEWFRKLGPAVVDGGNPLGPSRTVSASGASGDGGANPISGYSLINAESMDAAIEMAKGCPILGNGTVEIAEAISM